MAIPPSGEAAATALGIYEAQGERASILFFVTGKRTRELARVAPRRRARRHSGRSATASICRAKRAHAAIVAGGVGIASVLLPAQRLVAGGTRVELLYGARSAELLVDAQRFADAGCELCVCDRRRQRRASRIRHRRCSSGADAMPDLILACGPSPMLRAVGRIARERGVRAQLSLEETFACGVGGCWGCVVPLARTSAQAPGFPPARRRQRRRLRAHLQRRSGLLGRRVEMVR